MGHRKNPKTYTRNRASESLSCTSSRYSLRSQGPPNYERFADEECPICLEEYAYPVIVNCGHSFCNSCIKKCIRERLSGSNKCPVCKESLIPELFIRFAEFTKRIGNKNTPKKGSNVQESEQNEIHEHKKRNPAVRASV